MSDALNIIQDPTLTYKQELLALARLGESTDDSLRYSDEYYEAKAKGALCDLNEGVMPYRPRYICPDYELLFQKGCRFLDLEPVGKIADDMNYSYSWGRWEMYKGISEVQRILDDLEASGGLPAVTED